ncbi:hypothetical protein [Noviherbaspirillum galbum]|uniref:PDZ domain-containing protein n=1 Tax=Noviherbaspirillum galbum TaxID=2709383 RepID=A0A6B3SJ17_9BURK|nr:hypothetical protein [Noviherbaspirillum galbum]NEX60703.1 hypothetical protein [Noviherbaspirillum galbum]
MNLPSPPWRRLLLASAALLLAACSAPKYTVDDGRQIDPVLLRNLNAYKTGHAALRNAAIRSSALRDAECDKQWEFPVVFASSKGMEENERVAWVRVAGVDERLTVLASAIAPQLEPGDKILRINDSSSVDPKPALEAIARWQENGTAFSVVTHNGKKVEVKPVEVCRGHPEIAPPASPLVQDYHWLKSVHPLELFQEGLTDDEALWITLWTQGLSEEAGARMKTFHYGTSIAKGIFNIATTVAGVKGAVMAAQAAVKTAQSAATTLAVEQVKKQLANEASDQVMASVRESIINNTKKMLIQKQAADQMALAAANRGSLSGVSWVAASAFDKADQWALERIRKLNADPLAAFTLHQKLIGAGYSANAFLFDAERLDTLMTRADEIGIRDEVVAVLNGTSPDTAGLAPASMPLSSDMPASDMVLQSADPARSAGADLLMSDSNTSLDLPLETKNKP